ncbi:MAG: flagellar protein FlaG [Pelotomaculum sp. PtaB.Bin104]|nr:MAG: flagellar protein FlaG [Pelotomaculum sp. PtaB.Bin104]
MEISSISPSISTVPDPKDTAAAERNVNAQTSLSDAQSAVSDNVDQKAVQKPTLQEAVNRINKALQELLDTGIQFSVHEDTKKLMVQVVDIKDKKVIKEFPPHEFLDIMARIREYIGVLLDVRV